MMKHIKEYYGEEKLQEGAESKRPSSDKIRIERAEGKIPGERVFAFILKGKVIDLTVDQRLEIEKALNK